MEQIRGAKYRDVADAVSGSYKYQSSQNVPVTDTASTPVAAGNAVVILSATDYYRFEINGTASSASPIHPPGMTVLVLDNKADELSFLRIGAVNSEVSIIVPGND